MDGQWLSYQDAARRMGVTAASVRRRAQRARWARQRSNSGLALVLVPDDVLSAPREPVAGDVAGDVAPDSAGTIAALEGHVATLKGDVERLEGQLKAAEARAETEAETVRKAIAAFASLADKLDALAAERSRPWWRRIVG
jgi:hypothetical protein